MRSLGCMFGGVEKAESFGHSRLTIGRMSLVRPQPRRYMYNGLLDADTNTLGKLLLIQRMIRMSSSGNVESWLDAGESSVQAEQASAG